MDSEQFHRISKALADPRRYEILSRIAKRKELACSDVRCELPITAATLSHHVKELVNAGLPALDGVAPPLALDTTSTTTPRNAGASKGVIPGSN